MNAFVVTILSTAILQSASYQDQHTYPGDVVKYAASLEFINCDKCPASSVKTKKVNPQKEEKPKEPQKENDVAVATTATFVSGLNADNTTTVTVYFNFNKVTLKESEKEKLSEIHGYPIRITGFTDSIGTKSPNKYLAQKRAENVAIFLEGKTGLPLSKKTITGKELCCYADTNKTESGRAKNRRVEILFRSQ